MTRPIPILLVLIAIALPLSLLAGRVWLDPWSTPNAALILAELRLPRSILALVVGAGLGAAGAAWAAGLVRVGTGSYLGAFMAAGALCLVASVMVTFIGASRADAAPAEAAAG